MYVGYGDSLQLKLNPFHGFGTLIVDVDVDEQEISPNPGLAMNPCCNVNALSRKVKLIGHDKGCERFTSAFSALGMSALSYPSHRVDVRSCAVKITISLVRRTKCFLPAI